MTDAASHDFNWVEAAQECSIRAEFARLQSYVQKNVDSRNSELCNHVFVFEVDSERCFQVNLKSLSGVRVSFLSEPTDHRILIRNGSGQQFSVTLRLNETDECRYQIDGEGEFLRWEVAKKALRNLLFNQNDSWQGIVK